MAPPHQSENSAPATVTTVDVTAARDLIAAAGGHRYLDVRTEEELSKLGHLVEVDRSINVPYMFIPSQGCRVKNAQFVEQVASLFTKEEHVVVGCQSGKRSEQACVDLQAAVWVQERQEHGRRLPCLAPPWVPRPPPHQPTAAAKPRRLACRQQLLKLNHPNSNHRYRAK
ncbi:thiosulfate sulfurtransferase 16, chloroplastic-like isoform X1 [Panicum virgatum]|uniref:thiosulfate sulfurtransferase 16, chloroplastic-like isoform X1 n=1 Tax=Panicum virgatum TaxID=38727 RepID=UPI0019D51943|nr:thiosulfate sulfurtransferase 16, chloroplastic-like isoform X1 [Panicum virgatum]